MCPRRITRSAPLAIWRLLMTGGALESPNGWSAPRHELGEQISMLPVAPGAVLEEREFAASVKQALRDLHQPSALVRNPLLASSMVQQQLRQRQTKPRIRSFARSSCRARRSLGPTRAPKGTTA